MIPLITLTAAYSPDQARNLSGEQGGQWTSQPPTPAAKAAAGDDEEAKQLFAQMLGMNDAQQAAFLKSLSPDKLKRLGMFAYLGTGDKQITAIRGAISKAMTNKGMNPVSVGADPPKAKKAAVGKKGGAAKKAPAAKKSGGSKSSSAGSKSTAPKASSKASAKTSGAAKVTVKTSSQDKATSAKAAKPTVTVPSSAPPPSTPGSSNGPPGTTTAPPPPKPKIRIGRTTR